MGTRTTVAELTVARRAMACEFSITFPGWTRNGADAGYAALDTVDRLEGKLSVYLDDSELSDINRTAASEPVRADREVYDILWKAVRLSRVTGGAFDAASGALVKAWGFYKGPRRVPTAAEHAAARAASGSHHVILSDPDRTVAFSRHGLEFNLGGIGKGYAIDRAITRVRQEYGIRSALMQGGQSSLRALGEWTVDIGRYARVRLHDCALGTSGADNQFFEAAGRRYGHILDPRTGWPAAELVGASAIARSATEADALSTAFFVLGVEGTREFLRKRPDLGAVLIVPRKTTPEVIVLGNADVEVF